jgi:putative FmdB family regulatory protein
MPIYEYMPKSDEHCDHCESGFELLQKINDASVQTCPRCEAPVKRVISAPNVGRADPSLEPSNLEKHGFTQYRKSSKGEYHKTAGKGPKVISNN